MPVITSKDLREIDETINSLPLEDRIDGKFCEELRESLIDVKVGNTITFQEFQARIRRRKK